MNINCGRISLNQLALSKDKMVRRWKSLKQIVFLIGPDLHMKWVHYWLIFLLYLQHFFLLNLAVPYCCLFIKSHCDFIHRHGRMGLQTGIITQQSQAHWLSVKRLSARIAATQPHWLQLMRWLQRTVLILLHTTYCYSMDEVSQAENNMNHFPFRGDMLWLPLVCVERRQSGRTIWKLSPETTPPQVSGIHVYIQGI